MIGYHSNTHLADKRVIAPTVAHRRLVEPVAVRARSAAVKVASARMGISAIAQHLGIGLSSAKRLRSMSTAPALARAVELQLRFREAVDRSIAQQPLEERRWVSPPAANRR